MFISINNFKAFLILTFTVLIINSNAENGNSVVNQTELLQVTKLISSYFQTEEYLWIVIERREENTLEQIYNEHKIALHINQFQNVVERSRITVDFGLNGNLKFLNETSTFVFNILKNRDYFALDRYAKSQQVLNISTAIETIYRLCNTTEFWRDLNYVRV